MKRDWADVTKSTGREKSRGGERDGGGDERHQSIVKPERIEEGR